MFFNLTGNFFVGWEAKIGKSNSGIPYFLPISGQKRIKTKQNRPILTDF